VTIDTDQGAGSSWDTCADSMYIGTFEFEATSGDTSLYNVYTIEPTGVGGKLNDMSFGGYYPCYAMTDQGGMPNSDASNPTLFFQVGDNGVLGFTGASQWGEVFSITDVTMDTTQLNFQWTNDYGEGAMVQLVR
jgi:hypothetical protein